MFLGIQHHHPEFYLTVGIIHTHGAHIMSNVANIENEIEFLENRITKLDASSLSKFRDWFIEFDNSRWDKKLEADSNAGKLDFLIDTALAEHQEGKTRDL